MTTPGYGTAELHLGQVSSELKRQVGLPKTRNRVGAFREYWIYPDQRFEAVVSRRSHRLLSLFFHRGSALAAKEFFGRTENEIQDQFGEPWKDGGGIMFEDGDYLARWFSYRSGIAFFFDREGIVETVCINAKYRRLGAKPTVSATVQHRRQLAALIKR